MALDLPPIVQSNQTNQPDMARTMLAAQQIKQGNVAAQHEADLPGAVSAYQNGDQGALGQIYADNPEVANSLQNMALRKQEVGQEGALANVQIAGEKQKQQMAAIDLQNAKQNQTDLYAMQARPHLENMSDTVAKMEEAKADPTTIQDFITKAHAQGVEQLKAMGAPVNAHDDGTDYISNPTIWKQNAAAALQNIDMHAQNYQLRNMTPEQRQFASFKNMSPEDKQNLLAFESKNPYMLKTGSDQGGGGAAPAAPAGPPLQGPTQGGAPLSAAAPASPPIKNNAIDENVDLGKDALNTINSYPGSDQIKRMAKNMLLAQQPAPAMTSRTPPDVKEAFELAQQADSSYSTMSYPSKLKITNAFLDGPEAKNNVAIQTVIHHLGQMSDNDKNLSSSGSDLLNAIYNDVAPHLSDKAKANLNNYKIDQTAVGTEAAKAYKGVGSLSEGEQKDWSERLNANNGPEARAAARKEIGQLAMGKIQALQDQWKTAYPNSTRSFFTPKTIQTLNKLGVDTSDINLPGQAASPKAPAAPALPPTDAKGGVLHADKNGVQAYVYPDGTFKEVK